MIKNPNDYLTTHEVAVLLGFSVDYVRKLILLGGPLGKMKAKKIGRQWFVLKKDVKKFKRVRFPREIL